jgi:hypothetical protein
MIGAVNVITSLVLTATHTQALLERRHARTPRVGHDGSRGLIVTSSYAKINIMAPRGCYYTAYCCGFDAELHNFVLQSSEKPAISVKSAFLIANMHT